MLKIESGDSCGRFSDYAFSGYQTDTDYIGAPYWLVTEQITIFHRKLFPNIIEQIGNFQEGTPLRADISEIGLGDCFRKFVIQILKFRLVCCFLR